MIKHPLFILTAYPNLGGIENVTTSIASDLYRNHGIEIDVFSFISNDQYADLIPNGIKMHEPIISGGFKSFENQGAIERVAKENQVDAIIYQDSYAPSHEIVMNASKNLGIPLIVFEHNTPDYGLRPRHYGIKKESKSIIINSICKVLYSLLNSIKVLKNKKTLINRKRFLYNASDRYVLLSEKFVPIFKELVPTAGRPKLTVINNPIKAKDISEYKLKENIIFCAARLVPQKNIEEMLYIWLKIYASAPDWKFIVAGTGPNMEYLKSLAQKLGVRGIEFVGYVDPTDYYKKSKIFWMTSLFEGFGLTLVEAQTYGCVPIAYDSFASASDIITNGKNGFLIKNGDRKAFIKATLKLIIDGNLWNQMSQESINNYEKFETKTTVKKWLNLFSSI